RRHRGRWIKKRRRGRGLDSAAMVKPLVRAKLFEPHYLGRVFDREKFKRLVHYVIWRAGEKPGFGATKLNKVLWFAEARQYALTGRPIADAAYVREKFGPVPRGIMTIRKELEDEHKIRIYPAKSAYEGWRFRSLIEPDRTDFSSQELATV